MINDKRIVIKKYRNFGLKKTWKKRACYRYVMKCLSCGKEFDIMGRDYNRGRGLFCGDKCKVTGKYNPRWKGGKRDGYGYVLIHKSLVSDKYHYLAKDGGIYIREHRLVMAKKIKRKLRPEELVHHLNGVKDDNRLENLVIKDSQSHEKYTLWKLSQKRIAELEEEIKRLKK